MATIDWPAGLIPQTAQLTLRKAGTQFASPFNGSVQAFDFVAERWVLSGSLAPQAARNPQGVDSFCNTLAGGIERVRVWPFHTGGVPRGTLRGAPTLQTTVTRGATQLALTGCRAGANVFRESALAATFLDGWGAGNGTIAYNATTDPLGGNTAATLTRTAAGIHYLERYFFSFSSTPNRSVAFAIWLRRGTITEDVRIVVRDGVSGNETALLVSPTTEWQRFIVAGFMPSGAAPGIGIFVDTISGTGGAGETLHFWAGEIDVTDLRLGNATVLPNTEVAPTGALRAHVLRRVATGDHFTYHDQSRTVGAGEQWTYSVWLRALTLTGNVQLQIATNTGAMVATATVTPTATWQRFSVTGTFSTSAFGVRGLINPVNNAGAAGDALAYYGEQMEPGGGLSDYSAACTLLAGDFIGAGGQLFMLQEDAVDDRTGQMLVKVINRVRGTIASGSPVTWYRPSCEMVLPAMQAGPVRRPGVIDSTALDLVEVW